jgi:signal transduction histidine kinase
MTPHPPAPAAQATGLSAWAATAARLRATVWRRVAVVGGVCLGIALLLTAMDGRGFAAKLVYSLCIGAVCTIVVDAMRLAMAWWVDRGRRARGLVTHVDPESLGWRGAIPGVMLAVVAGPPTGMWLGDQFTGLHTPGLLDIHSNTTRVTLMLSLLATVISVVVISTLERLSSARIQAEAAQRQAAETQLRLLQSQLEPHMLFNTLANLRVLVGLDPLRAQAMLDHLIAFLRATLSASRLPEHPLATEFERVDDYLALMAVRMGPRLQVVLDLPPGLGAVNVPPMLLQPLVENAIKHGLEPQVQGGRIEVQARQDGSVLCLTVRDTGVGLAAAPACSPPSPATSGAGGFGLAQVRQRLATLYGGQASVTLAPAPDAQGGTVATLRLPLAQAATAAGPHPRPDPP